MLTVALAKGRTVDDLLPLWGSAGLPLPSDLDDTRALVFEVPWSGFSPIRYLLAKPADVPTYVSFGVADIGVVGKDVLLEQQKEMYELLDLDVSKCRLCVAGLPQDYDRRPERVATKYPKLADAYFRSQGQSVEIVPLSGSIELASVIGLTDRIFDLVQTGSTLVANGLTVFDTVYDISARLVANRSSYRMKNREISEIVRRLNQAKAVRGDS
ncbi:ATP phosphoribosyltransferase [Alicyclobacillus fastidiosus]|uniref:ATP phosphoribosyltransferase n=1 Tax=Alicyclobacillus fastidiosus TaxID=392011 RepID=A0ABV5ADD4_9BACL|nr:ATP phosphoribosyltransferase [Alicyclobacillus fastidiosus]WEH08697.1 ATP phosphoribosyltransferase [Alicyclobacillus fastidiosus]